MSAAQSSYDQVVTLARNLAQDQPPTSWETVIPAEGADFIRFLDGERVLVGTVEWGGALGLPRHGNLMLFNSATGRLVWTAKRENLGKGQYALLLTEPVIVIVGKGQKATRFQAHDPATGSKLWSYRVSAPDQFFVTSPMDRIITLSASGKSRVLAALDVKTGKPVWSRTLSGDLPTGNGPDLLFPGDGAVFVAGQGLLKLSESNGEIVWRRDHASLAAQGRVANHFPDGVLVYHSRSMALLRQEDGSVLWEDTPQDGTIVCASIMSDRAYRALSHSDDEGEAKALSVIQALDVRSGRVLWSTPIQGSLASPLHVEGDLLVFTTDGALYGIEAGSGELAFMESFSVEFASGSPTSANELKAPDSIRFELDRLYVARELSGIMACSFPSGVRLWEQLIMNQTAKGYSADRLWGFLTRDLKRPAKPESPQVKPARGPDAPDLFIRSAQSQYEHVKQRTEAVLQNPRATDLEREMAHTARVMNVELMMANMQVNMAMDRMMAAGELLNAVLGMQGAIRVALETAAMQGAISRAYMQLQSWANLPQNCFQGRYYLWPFAQSDARGVTTVDLETGRRFDLLFSPSTAELNTLGIDLPTFRVDPEGTMLLMVGVGLDPSRYEKRTKWKMTVPQSSVLAYDIRRFDFGQKSPLQIRTEEKERKDAEAAGLDTEEMKRLMKLSEIHIAAQMGDLGKVKALLNAGVDVNTKYPPNAATGPLYWAITGRQTEVAKLLISRGADVNQGIEEGNSPLFWAKHHECPEIIRILEEAGARERLEG